MPNQFKSTSVDALEIVNQEIDDLLEPNQTISHEINTLAKKIEPELAHQAAIDQAITQAIKDLDELL